MPYGIEVYVTVAAECGHGTRQEWRRLKPTHGAPYVFQTRAEAEKMQRICYGDPAVRHLARVVEVTP